MVRVLLLAIGLLALSVQPALAHGPTIRVAYGRITPPALTVKVGDTVHFENANASGAPCTVVADDGSFESPTLGRAEGYHHRFDRAGEFAFHVRESSKARVRVTVVAD